jgi:hypothetical protein
MVSLVLKMSVSLDGYIAPVDGSIASVDGSADWIAAGGSADGLSWTVETVSNAGANTRLTIEPASTTVFSGGAVAHVFAGHPA